VRFDRVDHGEIRSKIHMHCGTADVNLGTGFLPLSYPEQTSETKSEHTSSQTLENV